MKKLIQPILMVFALSIALPSFAQLKVPALSPTQTVKQNFALSEISIEYSRPSARGRVVYGDVVAFDRIWRTGANASTKITFGEDVKIEGQALPKGTYALYTIPGKTEWTIIFNKNLTLWGDMGYKEEEDALRVKVKPSTLSSKVETFTIELSNMTTSSASLDLVWENTRVSVAVKAEIDEKIMKDIDAAINVDKRPYYQAANYYYENNKDLTKALEWVSKATELNPKAYWVFMLKARIQYKLKDFKGCMTTCDQVVALATEEKNEDYIKMGNELKEDAKKGK